MRGMGMIVLSALTMVLAGCSSDDSETAGGGATGGAGGSAATGGGGSAGGGATGGASGSGGSAATGGSGGSSTGGAAGASAGGAAGSSSGGAAGSSAGGAAGSSSGGAAGSSSGGAAGSSAGGAGGTGASCPDVYGTYQIDSATGTCNDINTSAPQSIEGSTQYCALHFVSNPSGATGAVNGGADLQSDGTFSGTSLYLGTAQRTPCSGVWNGGAQTMTVTCGGTSDQCVVVMTRTGT